MGLRALALLAFLSSACGARSGLLAPDVEAAVAPDAADAADVAFVVPRDTPFPIDTGLPPVDETCRGGCPFTQQTASYPRYVRLERPQLPADCMNGFELGGASGGCGRAIYTLFARRPGGARAINLYVDFATYLAPDGVIISALDAAGQRYVLLQQCRLQTSDAAGPSDRRPPDNTIRQFHLAVREGTSRIDIDLGPVTTPMYLMILGLCDFNVTPFSSAVFWRAVP